MNFPPIRRIVTGHDATGKAVVASAGPLPTSVELPTVPGTFFHEVWATSGAPPVIDNGEDPTIGALTLPPPRHGTRIRIVDIPPDSDEFLATAAARMGEHFASMGDASASTVKEDSPHPLMHRTETIDYGVVLEGRLTLVLDDSEVELEKGTVVVQRGTNHAWANRSGAPARMLFVLVDARYSPDIAEALKGHNAAGR
ncbi:MAG TPA: cupin domain-containing protein [Rhizobiales bacterium]|nr:cupin domain-containing protein [Hyphomicrobiales bacterium]